MGPAKDAARGAMGTPPVATGGETCPCTVAVGGSPLWHHVLHAKLHGATYNTAHIEVPLIPDEVVA